MFNNQNGTRHKLNALSLLTISTLFVSLFFSYMAKLPYSSQNTVRQKAYNSILEELFI